jgi:hypothetical protein
LTPLTMPLSIRSTGPLYPRWGFEALAYGSKILLSKMFVLDKAWKSWLLAMAPIKSIQRATSL